MNSIKCIACESSTLIFYYYYDMKRNLKNTKLTKTYIESKISQIQIMSTYLNISISIIEDCINKNKLIKSVFRDDDENGSMGFTYNNKGRLKVRDFGGLGFFGDIYDVVAYILSKHYKKDINTNNKEHFIFILQHISKTFKSIIYGSEIDEKIESLTINTISNKKPIIELVSRNWNEYDIKYWAKYNVKIKDLNNKFVIPVDQYYIDRHIDNNPKYFYNKTDPCYAYIIGKNRNNVLLTKLYFPYRNRSKTNKFITNCNVLEGLLNLELDNYDYIIITKSSKDRISIGTYISHLFYGGLDKLNIGIINVPSENYRLKENEYEYLTNKLNENGMIFSFFDFDYTGRTGAKYLLDKYNIPFLFITNGMFNLYNYKAKDFTDLHEVYTKDEIINFVKETLKYIELNKPRYECRNNQLTDKQNLFYNNLPY